MNNEISRLEAELLNIEEAMQPVLAKLNEYNSLAAAEVSRRISGLPGSECIMVRSQPARYDGVGIHAGLIVEGRADARIDIQKAKDVVLEVEKEYEARKEQFIGKILRLGLKQNFLQHELCQHTVVSMVREDHPHPHAYLLIVREGAVYIANVKYSDGKIIKRAGAVPELLATLKRDIDCNIFEVTHESRLASKDYMTEFSARRVYDKARAKQL
jgi:hypothetical protein